MSKTFAAPHVVSLPAFGNDVSCARRGFGAIDSFDGSGRTYPAERTVRFAPLASGWPSERARGASDSVNRDGQQTVLDRSLEVRTRTLPVASCGGQLNDEITLLDEEPTAMVDTPSGYPDVIVRRTGAADEACGAATSAGRELGRNSHDYGPWALCIKVRLDALVICPVSRAPGAPVQSTNYWREQCGTGAGMTHPPLRRSARRNAMSITRGRPAVFLDRDGTVTEPRHYPSSPSDLVLQPGVADALRELQHLGVALVLVTNQSGLARGFFTWHDLTAMHAHLCDLLGVSGVRLDGIYVCPHHPEGTVAGLAVRCGCRKPEGGLLFQAAEELGLDLERSWMVGDFASDVLAGHRAGCRTAWVGPAAVNGSCDDTVRPDLRRATSAEALLELTQACGRDA